MTGPILSPFSIFTLMLLMGVAIATSDGASRADLNSDATYGIMVSQEMLLMYHITEMSRILHLRGKFLTVTVN